MSISILTQSDFLAYIADQALPNGNLSIRGVARCCGVEHTTIIRGGAFAPAKLGQTLTQAGFEAGVLIENGFPPQAVGLCIEYFAYESKAKATQAKQLARTFGSIGIITTLKELVSTPKIISETQQQTNPALQSAKDIRQIYDLLPENPRLAQLLVDSTVNYYIGDQLTLVGSAEPELKGVVEIAEELGFKTDESSRVKLGIFVKSIVGHLARSEKRFCNGLMRSINCYPDIPEVQDAVKRYFS